MNVRRLVDGEAATSPEEARLKDLVAASERTTLPEASKADVLDKVLSRQSRRRARPSSAWALRPAIAAAVLLLAGITTAATVGRRWIAERLPLGTSAPAGVSAPRPAPPPLAARQARPSTGQTRVESPAVPQPPPIGSRRARPARGEDPARIVAAIQALRTDHDPARAGKLLDEYLRVYPHGALAEEALALSIEAADARRDRARAASLAERYLHEYPQGRFRRAAEQARQPAAP